MNINQNIHQTPYDSKGKATAPLVLGRISAIIGIGSIVFYLYISSPDVGGVGIAILFIFVLPVVLFVNTLFALIGIALGLMRLKSTQKSAAEKGLMFSGIGLLSTMIILILYFLGI